MKHFFMPLAAVIATLTLSSCLTASLITNADFTTPERQVTKEIGQDKVFLFGKIRLSKAEHLVMMGRNMPMLSIPNNRPNCWPYCRPI